MNERQPARLSRRTLLQHSGRLAAVSALAGASVPRVHAAEDSAIRVALVGCGGRGTGAAADALSVERVPLKLVAMADVFEDRLDPSHGRLAQRFAQKVDVPADRRFVGFDGYRHAMDCLRPGDIVILTTPPAFRWVHFQQAIAKGLNVFMEKPTTVDGPTTRRMLELAEQSERKNLKVGVGLMWRHCRSRQELARRVHDGELGNVNMLRAYRMHGPIGAFASKRKPEGMNELLWQIRRFHSFLWASGGAFSDFYIHKIDQMCWFKDAWPIHAQSTGGRHYRLDNVDQNFDHYSVEYTFADGSKAFQYGRCIDGCYNHTAAYIHGSRRMAASGPQAKIYDGQAPVKEKERWRYPENAPSPYQAEWNDLVDAIVDDHPYNEARRGAEASLVTSMGRMAAHTGQLVTFDAMLACEHEFAPGVADFTMESSAPVQADADGRYPVPMPGVKPDREY
jgi:predicted dehydrogenase